ncbi:MAG TPA: hypothetical protein VMJ73_13740 [Rhizomicrobium sp.]|nr:hypothetical protein [Rhizomicrobium sp.]
MLTDWGAVRMTLKRKAAVYVPDGQCFVEVDGADGLKHHVGPFATRQQAQDWIAQNAPDRQLPQDEIRRRNGKILGRLVP